jgi:quercetin dioxygenase-like cupin family protein
MAPSVVAAEFLFSYMNNYTLRQSCQSACAAVVESERTPRSDMTFIDSSKLPTVERLPGWRGRYFDSANMTFAHYEFDAGSSIHEHSHPQEEVYEIIEGELELTVAGVTQRLGPGFIGIVPSNTLHSVKAISSGKLIVVDYPLREGFSHLQRTVRAQ